VTDELPATPLRTPVHSTTRTWFNKNTRKQVKADAADLDAAVKADANDLATKGGKPVAS
jgi:hypothetical protein